MFLLKVSHQLLCQNETKDSSTPDVERRLVLFKHELYCRSQYYGLCIIYDHAMKKFIKQKHTVERPYE